MVDSSLYAGFLATAVTIIVIPGPDMMFIVTMGARGGPMTGLVAAFGTAVGLAVHTTAAVLGLSALFTTLPLLYDALRWAGAGYLLYLATKAFRARAAAGSDACGPQSAAPTRARAFWQAVLVDVLNPKAILLFVALLPQFVAPERGPASAQFLILGATFVGLDLVIDGLIGLVAGGLTRTVWRRRRVGRCLEVLSGAVLACLAVRLAITQR